jgi:glucosyl-3-phosphoglycerate synthase
VETPGTTEWENRTYRTVTASLGDLLQAKEARSLGISVVLPALDEEETIGAICRTLSNELIEDVPLVDELLVIDSGSTDATAEEAIRAGAVVHRAAELTGFGEVRGKGDCLWRSLTVASGDIIVWLDSDTRNMHGGFVSDLIAPLLLDDRFVMTKAFYDRPLVADDQTQMAGGARVTEIAVRPLLQLFYPELVGLIQPLAGEYAGYTEVFKELRFATGYGVEIGLLIDIAERHGVEGIAQVDLGMRVHRNRTVMELGRSSFQVISTMLRRLDEIGRIKIPDGVPNDLLQFLPSSEGPVPMITSLEVLERPPVNGL